MEVTKGKKQEVKTEGTEQKLSYEQLNNACNQLWQQNQQLTKRNAELEQYSMYKRFDYLFKVLEYKDNFSSDFVISCAGEIEEAIGIPQKEEGKE